MGIQEYFGTLRNSSGEPRVTRPPYPVDTIEVWDWASVNIRQESQKLEKRAESIRARVIQRLLQTGEYVMVFDDDASGEVGSASAAVGT